MSDVICSARHCKNPASWSVVWRNPKLHAPDRRKIWVACDEHRTSLSAFLDLRGFLLGVEPLGVAAPEPGGPADTVES
ncbi:hypothetical protein [Longispora fulva]|uniref:Acetone carboxylase n=1 Tax=Longispora fulva TaxID=619741 RepID=A0A8J7GP00_9ACTN|nr:hypothetical protein [Longispora fulva]MBG6141370.1 hypothetical protein [Longispora fulva]